MGDFKVRFDVDIKNDNTELIKRSCREQRAKALEMIGLYAEDKARGMCPKRTGRWQNSITHICDSRGSVNTVVVGTNVEYGKYIELGHKWPEKWKKKPKAPYPPNPFIKPSIENYLSVYQSMIEECLKS